MKGARPLTLEERLRCDAALASAFAPLRGRGTNVSPARVRAAVRWGLGDGPTALPWSAPIARLGELAAAVGMSALLFAATLGDIAHTSVVHETADVEVRALQSVRVTEPLEGARYIRWLRIDRDAPMEDRLDPSIPPARAAAEPDAPPTVLQTRAATIAR